MGEAYRVKGEPEQAIAHYEKALLYNPDLRMAQRRISQLREN